MQCGVGILHVAELGDAVVGLRTAFQNEDLNHALDRGVNLLGVLVGWQVLPAPFERLVALLVLVGVELQTADHESTQGVLLLD